MMKTIRDAINIGAREVQLVNGTYIRLPDIGQGDFGIAPPKNINGKKVYRWIFCLVQKNRNTKGLEDLARRKMGEPFRSDEYCIPEREMNLFISENGGISEYGTRFWIDQFDHDITLDQTLDYLCSALENI